MEKPILIASCGDTFPGIRTKFGNFDLWFLDALEEAGTRAVVWNAHQGVKAPDIAYSGILITGSPAMVTDRAQWSESLRVWVKAQADLGVPTLGVCYGHQLLADAYGGKVDYQPDGREIGSLLVTQTPEGANDPLFSLLPGSFYAHLTHAQSVIKLPKDAVLLAKSGRVSCQAFRIGSSAWGVQFHPEFTQEVMAGYLEEYKPQIPPSFHLQLQNHLHDCPEARSVLHGFAKYCRDRDPA